MNKTQREPWLEFVASVEGPPCDDDPQFNLIYPLCSFCQYCDGFDDGYPDCVHPIDYIREDHSIDMLADHPCDCWAFRPGRLTKTIEAAKRFIEHENKLWLIEREAEKE